MFFALGSTRSFVLSGGAALISHDLISRSTGDLDLFTVAPQQLDVVVDEFVAEASRRDWSMHIVRQSPTFARVEISNRASDLLVVDLGVESPPALPLTASAAGPTFQPIELAARKLLALFGRAAARDFCDLYELSDLYELADLCALAGRIDSGFNAAALAEALGSVDRLRDAEFSDIGAVPTEVRAFASRWRRSLLGER